MADELEGTQALPEGETVAETSDETVNDDELDTDAGQPNERADDAGEESEAEAEAEGSEAEAEPEPEKPKKVAFKDLPKWAINRINEETNKRKQLEEEITRLRAGSQKPQDGDGDDGAPQQPPEDAVTQRARQLLEQEKYQQTFNSWDERGRSDFGASEFRDACSFVASLATPQQAQSLVNNVIDPDIVPDGHKVIMELAGDPDELTKVLNMPPHKQAVFLARMASEMSKTTEAPAPAPKPISKAPPPVAPVGGKAQASVRLDDPNVGMDEFASKFLKDLGARKR